MVVLGVLFVFSISSFAQIDGGMMGETARHDSR
jgi:hypothetical protein